jgi:hypothetical protein
VVQSFEAHMAHFGASSVKLLIAAIVAGALALATVLASVRTSSTSWSVRNPTRERCTYIYVPLSQLDNTDKRSVHQCPR